jgi:hypothetical protein
MEIVFSYGNRRALNTAEMAAKSMQEADFVSICISIFKKMI